MMLPSLMIRKLPSQIRKLRTGFHIPFFKSRMILATIINLGLMGLSANERRLKWLVILLKKDFLSKIENIFSFSLLRPKYLPDHLLWKCTGRFQLLSLWSLEFTPILKIKHRKMNHKTKL